MESLTTESSSITAFKLKNYIITTPVKTHPHVGPSIDTPDRVTHRKTTPVGSGSGTVRIKGSALLPQKYEMLCQLMDAMVSSIRLLRLKRQPATLTKLAQNIESLTDRRFTMNHLAQLKHIMPEVIVVKKIHALDDETSCMKEDLLISLDTSGGCSLLKGVFHSQIIDYAMTHSEEDDVPEGELPELFYKQKQETEPSMNRTSVVHPTTLMGCSFIRRFSSRVPSVPVEESSPAKPLPETPIKASTFAVVKDEYSRPTIATDATPSKFASTPVKVVSTPARLMTATPALRTPKRSLMTDDVAIGFSNKSAKRRALNFDENCDDAEEQLCQDSDDEIDVQVHSSAASKDLLEVLPQNLLYLLMEKERKTLEEQDPFVSKAKKRQQLIRGVLKLFDTIQLLFQSIRRSTMTKEELIHKIITGHLDIVDKGEVEDQLKLLQEIAPEFISEHSCLSGDTLVRLNKSSCTESIRAKLLEAK